jgi:hypothetical protein
MQKQATKPKPIGGEMGGLAFIYWSEQEKRYELKIDNKLKAYTEGDHESGKPNLRELAEEKGYTVLEAN